MKVLREKNYITQTDEDAVNKIVDANFEWAAKHYKPIESYFDASKSGSSATWAVSSMILVLCTAIYSIY